MLLFEKLFRTYEEASLHYKTIKARSCLPGLKSEKGTDVLGQRERQV